jgi:peptidoglycan/xylan/chitin deacetylase (PgdA/CDA1 family)
MVQEGVKVFCFHSVRQGGSLPPAAFWKDADVYKMFQEHASVDWYWFFKFIPKAIAHWGKENLVITFDDAYSDVFVPALYCRELGVRVIIFVPTAHIGDFIDGVPLEVVSESDIGGLLRHDVEFGSHGHNHLDWSSLADEQVEQQLISSRSIIYSLKKESSPFLLAPPHGKFNLQNISDASDLGFTEIYGTLDNRGSEKVIRRCLADMNGYVEDSEVGLVPWPWSI